MLNSAENYHTKDFSYRINPNNMISFSPLFTTEGFIASMFSRFDVSIQQNSIFSVLFIVKKRLSIAPSLQTRGSDSHQHATIFRHFIFQLSLT